MILESENVYTLPMTVYTWMDIRHINTWTIWTTRYPVVAIPFFFRLASNAFPDIGSVVWIEKKKNPKKQKKSREVSE